MGITGIIDGDSSMAMWDGEFAFTLDDRSLLRAILIVEGTTEGWPEYTSGQSGYPTTTIYRHAIDKPGFLIVKQNEHLRTLLKGFLLENIRVADQKQMIASERERGFVARFMRRHIIGNLEAGLRTSRFPGIKHSRNMRCFAD